MAEYDLIQAEILKKRKELDELEDTYRSKSRKLEEKYLDFQETRCAVERLIDEKYQDALTYLKETNSDEELYQILHQKIENCLVTVDDIYQVSCDELSDNQTGLDTAFHKRKHQIEDDLELDYIKRRQACEKDGRKEYGKNIL